VVIQTYNTEVFCKERSSPWGGCNNIQSQNRPVSTWSYQEERNKVLAEKRRRRRRKRKKGREVVVGIRATICFISCTRF
jgi:hypothetical protein